MLTDLPTRPSSNLRVCHPASRFAPRQVAGRPLQGQRHTTALKLRQRPIFARRSQSRSPVAVSVPGGSSGKRSPMSAAPPLPGLSSNGAELSGRFRGAMPKDDTGGSRFLADHPTFDGRGVVVCIFDTGVDPGAAGLQTTTTGAPKVVDLVDCTGSGDVDCSVVRKAGEDGVTVEGLHGAKLVVNPDWKNPSGDWHVGARRLYELFPDGLVARMRAERARAAATRQRPAVAAANAALAAFNKAHPKISELSEADKKQKAELEARLKLLTELQEGNKDPGPLIHCLVWHDGAAWRAAIDTSEVDYGRGDEPGVVERPVLADFEPLTNFAAERRYGTFSAADACNYAVNIYDEGNTLSIVVDAGSHGTHVAGIVAAHHPEDPDLNGVAPGAQIISCKIGDTRLGSIETGTGVTRALIHTLAAKADVINMSYGEATTTPDAGRFMDLAAEVVQKHGVVFVSSAGNSGPALSTVGAPGGTSSAILSIGAFVSPDLAAAGHSVRELDGKGQQYTWSSRGPTADGDVGVVLSAPGGAIAPVPNWTRQRRQLMNGTSMSSPNAAGCVSLLLSGLKQTEGAPISPALLRRALENTAAPVRPGQPDDVLTHGRGLIQVDKAWDLLRRSAELDMPDFWYDVRCRVSGSRDSGRGVYLREPSEAVGSVTVSVSAAPKLHQDADVASERLAIEHKLVLRPSAGWVDCPEVLLVHHNGRGFEMRLDCDALSPGLHYAEVMAYDSGAPWRGPLFRVPITVVKPVTVGPAAAARPGYGGFAAEATPHYAAAFRSLDFTAGAEHRRFVAVPEGATWCEMRLTAAAGLPNPCNYFVRATQLRPAQKFSDGEGARAFVQLSANQEWVHSFAVQGGGTLEVTLAQFWSSLGASRLDCMLEFHGVCATSAGSGLSLEPGGPVRLELRAPFRRERFQPTASFSGLACSLRPAETVLDALTTPRDTLPEGRVIHQLILTYKLPAPEPGKYRPNLPGLYGLCYDASFEVCPLMLFDANKQLLAQSDPVYPGTLEIKKKVEHSLRVSIRHDNASLLERLKAVPLALVRQLDPPLSVPVYGSNADAMTGGKVIEASVLLPGASAAVFVGPLPDDKLPKDAVAGKTLVGCLSLGLSACNGAAAPGKLPIRLSCAPAKEGDAGAGGGDGSKGEAAEKSADVKMEEAVRDAQLKMLKELKFKVGEKKGKDASVEELYERTMSSLESSFPDHLPLLLEKMNRANGVEGDKRTPAAMATVVEAADKIIKCIDTSALAAFMARKCEDEQPGAKERKKAMEESKTALLEALATKCTALLDAGDASNKETGSKEAGEKEGDEKDAFSTAFAELRRWVDTSSDVKYVMLHSRAEERAGRLANAYKVLDKAAEPEDKAPSKEVLERRAALLEKLGWSHWAKLSRSRLLDMFPSVLPPV